MLVTDFWNEFSLLLLPYLITALSLLFSVVLFKLQWKKSAFALLAFGMFFFAQLSFVLNTQNLPNYTDDQALTVVTFSLRSSNPYQIEDIQNLMSKHSPDVLLLQEFRNNAEQLEKLKKIFEGYYFATQADKNSLVVSKLKVMESEFIGNIQQVTLVHQGEKLRVYNFHAPKFFLNFNNYEQFFQQLVSLIQTNEHAITLVGGDFNITVRNEPRKVLTNSLGFKSGVHTYAHGPINTFPSREHKLGIFGALISIDDIYVRGVDVSYANILDMNSRSDHKPVLIKIKL